MINNNINNDNDNEFKNIKKELILELIMYSKEKKNFINIKPICEFYECLITGKNKKKIINELKIFLHFMRNNEVNDRSLVDNFSKFFKKNKYNVLSFTTTYKVNKYINQYYNRNKNVDNDIENITTSINNIMKPKIKYMYHDYSNNDNSNDNEEDYVPNSITNSKIIDANIKYLYNNISSNYDGGVEDIIHVSSDECIDDL